MALQLNYNFNNGTTSASAYARISLVEATHYSGDNDKQRIQVCVYSSQQACTDNKQCDVVNLERDYDDTSSVSFADLYTWIKTQPGFESATDV